MKQHQTLFSHPWVCGLVHILTWGLCRRHEAAWDVRISVINETTAVAHCVFKTHQVTVMQLPICVWTAKHEACHHFSRCGVPDIWGLLSFSQWFTQSCLGPGLDRVLPSFSLRILAPNEIIPQKPWLSTFSKYWINGTGPFSSCFLHYIFWWFLGPCSHHVVHTFKLCWYTPNIPQLIWGQSASHLPINSSQKHHCYWKLHITIDHQRTDLQWGTVLVSLRRWIAQLREPCSRTFPRFWVSRGEWEFLPPFIPNTPRTKSQWS